MKNIILTTIVAVTLTSSANAQSFVDWQGIADGDTTGTGTWAGYGTVSYDLTWLPNSNGLSGSGGTPTPNAGSSFETGSLSLYPFGTQSLPGKKAIGLRPGTVDGTGDGLGYDMTFTFSDGAGGSAFPLNDPVFYLRDIDSGDFTISASLNGTSLDVSDWWFGTAQAYAAADANGDPSVWNSVDTLVGNGQSALYIHQFKPDELFDTLTFSARGVGAEDSISFGIGDVTVVPEPSSTALLGLGALGLLARRKR